MCGICGLVVDRGLSASLHTVQAMAGALAHRGPDHEGMMAEGPAALGHRRLSIIDLSAAGNQPMTNEDGTIFAVVNGEIYNFEELRRQLVAAGHRFRSRSDSEIVVHLYEEKGDALLQDLRGMFAFALWDGRRQRLLLARDRVGKKPLHYARFAGGFAFASELPALLKGLPFQPAVDLAAIDRYLTLQYVPAPLTAWQGVRKLPAGHFLTLEPGRDPEVRPYWQLSFAPRPDAPQTEAAAVAELRPLLEEAVQIRQMADVPLGAFLSGGVDSSLIVALMARASSRPVETFSIDFPGGKGEAPWARMVAQRWQTHHHEMMVSPNMTSILPELVRRYGEPFADSSAVPVYYLAKMTREHVKVALSGDGGDELFGGYRRYLWDKLAREVGQAGSVARGFVQQVLTHLPGAGLAELRAFGHRIGQSMAARYLPLIAHFAPGDKVDLLGPALREAAPTAGTDRDATLNAFARILEASAAEDDVNRLLDLDTQTYLPDDILVKVDIASMAHALEVRAPLLDQRLMEWAAGLPGELKLRGLRGKRILRRAAEGLVPQEILTRKKRGFALPVDGWFRGELRPMAHDLLTDGTARSRGLLEPAAVARLLAEQAAGRNHGERLWNLLVLELWLRDTAA